MTRPDEKGLHLLKIELERPGLTEPVDAAESRWDPWLLALAKIELEDEAQRPN